MLASLETKVGESKRPQVLLVEDEAAVAGGLKMVLVDRGCEVDIALTGERALERFGDEEFDLVVTDLRLPGISGLEVIRHIKHARPNTEVVVITGYPSVETAEESARMGVREYLAKPFTDDEFLKVVDQALSLRGAVAEEVLRESREARLIEKREVLRVLDRASLDDGFLGALSANPAPTLEGYRLTGQARAALASGDLGWMRENVGDLTEKQVRTVLKLLEREDW
ncbi:MAG: response regulator [Thermodesulfobacteriota bacterium]